MGSRFSIVSAVVATVALAGSAHAGALTPDKASLTFPNTGTGSLSASQNVQFTNSSGSPITVDTVTIGGNNAGEFQIAGMLGLPILLGPGVSLGVDVLFAPVNPGTRTARLQAQVRGEMSTTDVALSGVGVGPMVAVTPTPIKVGGLLFGKPVPPASASVSNAGGSVLQVTNVRIGGPDAARFSLAGLPGLPQNLGPSKSFAFQVNFTPSMPAQANATLIVDSNDPNTPSLVVPIVGLSGDPRVSLDIGTIIYGNQRVGMASLPQDVNVTNTGLSDLHVNAAPIIKGANAGDFSFTALPKFPLTLAVGDSFKFSVVFTPSMAGSRSAAVQISSDDPKSPQKNLNMSGNGTTPTASISPGMVDFGKVRVGAMVNQAVTISNKGTGPFNVTDVQITGPDKALFTASLAPPFVVSAMSATVLSITYTPTAVSMAKATLTITTDDMNLPSFQVALVGASTSPMFVLSPMSLDFGGVIVGATTPPQTFTISNTGNQSLTINTFQVSGAGGSRYSVTPLLKVPAMIPAGGMSTFTVTYKPMDASADEAQVLIAVDDPKNMSGQVSLHGFGQAPDIAITPMDMDTLDFGTVQVGQMKMLPIKIQNTGDAPLHIGGLKIAGMSAGFSTDPAAPTPQTPIVIGPLKTATINVIFAPKLGQSYDASIEIDPADPNLMAMITTILLKGVGTSPMVTVTPDMIDFGPITLGQVSMPRAIKIHNGSTKAQIIDKVVSEDMHFVVDMSSLDKNLMAGMDTAVTVTFNPDAEGNVSGRVKVYVLGTMSPVGMTLVTGQGVAAMMSMTPTPRGGCSTSGRAPGGFALLTGVAALGLLLRRRRRR